jgi:hypothetical protein
MSLSPTQQTLRMMRQQGRLCGIVERWNPYAGKFGQRSDLFGFIDIICLDPQRGIIGVQSCGQAFSEHDRKILEDCAENAIEWIKSGGVIELWGWRKIKKKRGGKAMIWQPRIKRYTLEDFNG